MQKKPIRVLVVDDSGFIRNALSAMIKKDPDLEVVGQASDGKEAIEMAEELQPDIITLDIIMPKLSGLEALEEILKKSPDSSVLMLSMVTEEESKATIEAISKGATDFIPKNVDEGPQSLYKLERELIKKIKAIGSSKRLSKKSPLKKWVGKPVGRIVKRGPIKVVAIGTSTGGPKALLEMMPKLPADLPVGGFIVQHIPSGFVETFAASLNEKSNVRVKVAENGEQIVPGCFLLAPANLHLKLKNRQGKNPLVRLDPKPSDSLHRPSVDQAFLSVADQFPGQSLGVIMTGMGKDGLEGARAMRNANCTIVAQNEQSCIVYGMPKAVVEENLADIVLPLSKLANYISRIARR